MYMWEPRILHVSAEHVLWNIITGIGWRRRQLIQLPSKTLWQCFVHYRHTVISDFPSFCQRFARRGRCCRCWEGCCSAKYVLSDELVSILIWPVQEYEDQIFERTISDSNKPILMMLKQKQLTESRKKRWVHLQVLTDLLRKCLIQALPTYNGDWYTYRFSAVVVAPGWVRRCKDSGSTL